MTSYANIVATGSYLPEIEVTTDMLRARFNGNAPEFADKMEASSGIRRRFYAPEIGRRPTSRCARRNRRSSARRRRLATST